ncbi:hypothetical protein J6524_17855 [Bradyrhizobium sp. WSM 1738]|uniref:hypothetical protein n=1 Tax=Bradyrhizobium hereditatis TaxID=2821405 RepID=UPI001CE37D65|nr:hypothetical protein [Bradyrhizobium hereditatis]MCA6116747.1 hypothetical protein [Bradyrhizobium hereditatis]
MNFSLVRAMWRDGEKTILEFVGSNAQTIEVDEAPGRNLSIRVSRVIESIVADFGNRNRRSVGRLRTGDAHPDHWHALA